MTPKAEKSAPQCVVTELAAGDASKTIYTTGAAERVVILGISAISLTAAAQETYVGDATPGKKAMIFPASWAAGSQCHLRLEVGLPLTVGQNLVVKPAAAGPRILVIAEFYVER